jgi:GNAT superfamily N-acetyltransferase
MQHAHVSDVARLCGEHGYPSTDTDVGGRFQDLVSCPDDAVFVALDEDTVTGWIHLRSCWTLESDPYVEVRGLVVDERYRRRGTGRLLMMAAERWAERRDIAIIRLRSNVVRLGAHAFYGALGYRKVKTQHAFEKVL